MVAVVVRRGWLWDHRQGVTAPLRASLPYLLDEVPWQLIPQALLSCKQLQTWMGSVSRMTGMQSPLPRRVKSLSWDPGTGHKERHERGPKAPNRG